MDLNKQSFLFDQASQRLGAAKAARQAATQNIVGGLGDIAGGVASAAKAGGFGTETEGGNKIGFGEAFKRGIFG